MSWRSSAVPLTRRRQFGSICKRASGRYQARYWGPDGKRYSAPVTFERKTDAARWLSAKETEIMHGGWITPGAGDIEFGAYSEQWMKDRVLKTRTRELYDGLLRNHLLPAFGSEQLARITLASIRRWRKDRLDAGPLAAHPFGPVTVAKAYRLLHAIMETASDDELIRRNPCRIDGAGHEDSEEREVIPLPVVFDIAAKIPARWRALVLLATFAQMRFGELAGLTRVMGPVEGPPMSCGVPAASEMWLSPARADDGNRTRMTSLEGWGSAIELHPHDARFGAP